MGRKSKYQTSVKPKLAEIKEWYRELTEYQICDKLGISVASFENYKAQYPELTQCLAEGKQRLIADLKETLRKKGKGFYYKEIKRIYTEKENGVSDVRVEESEKYMPPDLGAIHLLLKNLDENWRNDDKATMDLKREKLALEKQKTDQTYW